MCQIQHCLLTIATISEPAVMITNNYNLGDIEAHSLVFVATSHPQTAVITNNRFSGRNRIVDRLKLLVHPMQLDIDNYKVNTCELIGSRYFLSNINVLLFFTVVHSSIIRHNSASSVVNKVVNIEINMIKKHPHFTLNKRVYFSYQWEASFHAEAQKFTRRRVVTSLLHLPDRSKFW